MFLFGAVTRPSGKALTPRVSSCLSVGLLPPFSKNRRTYPHDCRAFFDRNFEIVSHAHRQLAAAIAKRAARLQLIPQFTQSAKVWTRAFGVFEKRRQSH